MSARINTYKTEDDDAGTSSERKYARHQAGSTLIAGTKYEIEQE